MLYDTNKLTSTYERGVISGANYADYPSAGTTYTERRQGGDSTPTPSLSCSFGRSYLDPESGDWYLQGGNVLCGDKNFFVADKLVNASTDGEYLVFIKLDSIKANTDDDEEIILPGIRTSTGTPQWDNTPYTEGVNYPSNTNFTGPTSSGRIIVPLGRMRIEDEVVSFELSSCGDISVNQCAGVLSYSRV